MIRASDAVVDRDTCDTAESPHQTRREALTLDGIVETAEQPGRLEKGPGFALFRKIRSHVCNVCAEILGGATKAKRIESLPGFAEQTDMPAAKQRGRLPRFGSQRKRAAARDQSFDPADGVPSSRT